MAFILMKWGRHREDTDMVYLKVDTTPGEALAYAKKIIQRMYVVADYSMGHITSYLLTEGFQALHKDEIAFCFSITK